MVDGNSIIRFSDIAEIRDTFKDAGNYARVNGQPSVSISVSKRTGTNTLEVTARIKEVIEAATAGTEITAEPDTSGEAS
jgi:multidrug efflux pump